MNSDESRPSQNEDKQNFYHDVYHNTNRKRDKRQYIYVSKYVRFANDEIL